MGYKHNKQWRKKHPEAWKAVKKKYYDQFIPNAYNQYLQWEDKELNFILDRKFSDRIISKKIGRSVKAIQVKRSRLKRGDEGYEKNYKLG